MTHITIDDQRYPINDADQEAAALIRLAGRDPKLYDLFLVSKKGVEERIRDNQNVALDWLEGQLRRHTNVSFVSVSTWEEATDPFVRQVRDNALVPLYVVDD